MKFLRRLFRHVHVWESIVVGPWQEAQQTAVLLNEPEPEDEESESYKWFRTELVVCRCGVTHERYQVVTETGMWVTE